MGSRRNIIAGSDGWLRIRIEPRGEIVSVPAYLQVEAGQSAGGRDFFTVLEGVHRGKRASVTAGNLSPAAMPLRKAARLVFNKSKGTLTCGDVQLRAMTAPQNPVPDGEHPLQIPDFPHQGGRNYDRFALREKLVLSRPWQRHPWRTRRRPLPAHRHDQRRLRDGRSRGLDRPLRTDHPLQEQ